MKKRHFTDLEDVDDTVRGCVLTIGNFDGVHRGHQRILSRARALADAGGNPVVALTFEPPPDLVVRPSDAPQRITPHAEKVRLLFAVGADMVVTLKSTPALLEMTPEEFIDQIIMGRIAPRDVVEGPNFFFGHQRAGTISTLRAIGARAGFGVHTVEAVVVELSGGAKQVSSTLIRRLVAGGGVEDAAELLGRPFTLIGNIVAGEKVGRVLEYPTANIDPHQQVTPPDGVYAGQAFIEPKKYPAAVSIGCKPTFGSNARTIEANLIGATGDFYGSEIRLDFLKHLREQKKFDTPEALKEQITKDIQHTLEVLGRDQ